MSLKPQYHLLTRPCNYIMVAFRLVRQGVPQALDRGPRNFYVEPVPTLPQHSEPLFPLDGAQCFGAMVGNGHNPVFIALPVNCLTDTASDR